MVNHATCFFCFFIPAELCCIQLTRVPLQCLISLGQHLLGLPCFIIPAVSQFWKEGRLSELFCVVLYTEAVHSHKHA